MPTAKRLLNEEGLRGTPSVGSAPLEHKRGLRGDNGGRFANKTGTLITGVTGVVTGTAGLGGGTNTFPGRGASKVQYGDARSVLDSDVVPLGASYIAPPSSFSVATGTGAAGSFEATPGNDGGQCQVAVYDVGADTDEDGDLLATAIINANGTAQTIALGAAHANKPVAVYCRRVSAPPRQVGRWFGTRRVVTTHA